ncbi:MAG TPA: hypothetical protein VIN04_14060 [Myxococcota bacterium]
MAHRAAERRRAWGGLPARAAARARIVVARARTRRAARGAAAVLALAVAAPALGQESPSRLVPLDPAAALPLGTAWDEDAARPVDEQGACMEGAGSERHDGGPTTWTLVVLSRAGGRLLVGVHVARTLASEALAEARIPDAARRLGQRDPDAFRALCGDAFVAARALGGQYVGEIEFGPEAARAASARLRTGVWTDPAPFRAALEALIALPGARARELPSGRRAEARSIAPSELAARALAFPDTVDEATARPFLARVLRYPEHAFAGTAIAIDPTLGWGDAARAVFLAHAEAGPLTSAAARAAEMRKAVVRRRPGDPRRAQALAAHDEPVVLSAESLAPAGEPPRSAATSAPRAAVESVVASRAERPATAGSTRDAPPAAVAEPAAPPAPIERRRMAALVYAAPAGETPVFATTEAPPGVYAEKVKQRVYWVPGVATPTEAVRAALARAAASTPERGTTIVVARTAQAAVVLTDVAPASGIHSEPAGALHAWIAGVQEPTPAQREALAAAARGGN